MEETNEDVECMGTWGWKLRSDLGGRWGFGTSACGKCYQSYGRDEITQRMQKIRRVLPGRHGRIGKSGDEVEGTHEEGRKTRREQNNMHCQGWL
jgi:hypothetical protein